MILSTKQQRIAEIAKRHKGEPITLLNHYIDEDWLRVAYRSLRKDSAPGIDHQSWEDYGKNLEENIKSLMDRAKSGSYRAPAVRGVEIPKPGSQEKRPLGIPTIEDKVLQKGILMVLEPIYEPEFYILPILLRIQKRQITASGAGISMARNNGKQYPVDNRPGYTEILRHCKA